MFNLDAAFIKCQKMVKNVKVLFLKVSLVNLKPKDVHFDMIINKYEREIPSWFHLPGGASELPDLLAQHDIYVGKWAIFIFKSWV